MDAEHFKQLYIPMRKHIMFLCQSYLKHVEEAEDATQETYLKLWNMKDKLEEVTQPKAFAMRVARNHCLDRLKVHREELVDDECISNYYQESEFDVLERLTAREQIKRIKHWLRRQEEPKKSIFVMRHFQGKTLKEIAEYYSLKEVNVRVILSRMRKEVNAMFD